MSRQLVSGNAGWRYEIRVSFSYIANDDGELGYLTRRFSWGGQQSLDLARAVFFVQIKIYEHEALDYTRSWSGQYMVLCTLCDAEEARLLDHPRYEYD